MLRASLGQVRSELMHPANPSPHPCIVMRPREGSQGLISSDDGVIVITLLSLTVKEKQERSGGWDRWHRLEVRTAHSSSVPASLYPWSLLVAQQME